MNQNNEYKPLYYILAVYIKRKNRHDFLSTHVMRPPTNFQS